MVGRSVDVVCVVTFMTGLMMMMLPMLTFPPTTIFDSAIHHEVQVLNGCAKEVMTKPNLITCLNCEQ